MRTDVNDGAEVNRIIARHFSSLFGGETTLGCTRQLTGRLSKARFRRRDRTKGLWRLRISPNPQPDARASLQFLGDMPWVSRATAIWPDTHYLARDSDDV